MAEELKHLGVMIDCSRNSVMSLDALKKYLPLLKKIGYNTVMLYTEDTYEVEGEPYFGYMRGRYSIAEMKEIDDFAYSLGIEMIPCIQTLAHLNQFLRWGKVGKDWDDIMLCDDDRTYEVIDRMMSTLSKCFRSKIIHVGMDEAYMLGRGHYQDIHGACDSVDIIGRHLKKVEDIGSKYGYEKFLCWSDMFFTSWNNRKYVIDYTKIPQNVIDSVDKRTAPVYWDYYHTEQSVYDGMIKNHKQITDDVWFGGGAWCWIGVTPLNEYSLKTMIPAMRAVKENEVKNIFFTMWGDDGGECSHFAQLAALYHLAEIAKGNDDTEQIKKSFFDITGMSYDGLFALDLPNKVEGENVCERNNPSKYMLFSDYFNDFLDYLVNPEAEKLFPVYAERIREYGENAGEYKYLFDTQATLCDVLAVKYTLGLKCRRAYENGDKGTLRSLAENDFPEVAKRIRIFADAFRKQWFTENKPCGFDVQDLHLGGILMRTETCRKRLLDYVNGVIDSIPEYEEKLLPFGGHSEPGHPAYVNSASIYTTTNSMW